MLELLWLIPALPFAGFCALVMAGQRLPRQGVAFIGAGSVGVSAVLAMLVSISFISFASCRPRFFPDPLDMDGGVGPEGRHLL